MGRSGNALRRARRAGAGAVPALMALLAGACHGEPPVEDPGPHSARTRQAAGLAVARAVAETPSYLYGVTVDSIDDLDDTLEALRGLSRRPTVRIVFDSEMPAAHYREAAAAIHGVGRVMGEILDSQFVSGVTVQQYLDRTSQYLDTLGDSVDIWEIGNEINGEWLGRTADVRAKMVGAFDIAKSRGKVTALTLHYNVGCGVPAANNIFTWARRQIPARMKAGLDYVFISYYEEDCLGRRPDWSAAFSDLGKIFPNSWIGFSETGTTHAALKAGYLRRYYTMHVPAPRYVGGYFWWYFKQDMVPAQGNPLWHELNRALMDMP